MILDADFKEVNHTLNADFGEKGMVTPVVDQTYKPESSNAQSGKAVAEGIEMTANGLEIGISEAKNIGYAAQEQANYAQQIAERVDVYVGVDLTNRINDLEAQVGNFDTVLNQLHNYAQSLIGGVA